MRPKSIESSPRWRKGRGFDLYWNRTVVLLFDALKRARGALPAAVSPIGPGSPERGDGHRRPPKWFPPSRRCSSRVGIRSHAERRDSCLKLSKIMQRGDTVIAQMAGFSIERRLSSARQQGSPKHCGASARARMAGVEREPKRRTHPAMVEECTRPKPGSHKCAHCRAKRTSTSRFYGNVGCRSSRRRITHESMWTTRLCIADMAASNARC